MEDEWFPQHGLKVTRRVKRQLLRQRNIRVPGDSEVNKLLVKGGLYKYLRSPISGTIIHSVVQAKQVVRNTSCFIAFILKGCKQLSWEGVLETFKLLTTDEGNNLFYHYTEYLSRSYYKPGTIVHNIDYIRLAMEWAVNIHKVPFSLNFNEYTYSIRRKVKCIHLVNINHYNND